MAKAKKQKPERLPGAEENCISPEHQAIVQWFKTVKFRKNLLGGVDEAAMWKKLEELYTLYDAAIRAERTRYNVLLESSCESVQRSPASDGLRTNPTDMPRPRPSGEVAKPTGFDGEGEPAAREEEHSNAPSGQ